jgi:hypothetical protein
MKRPIGSLVREPLVLRSSDCVTQLPVSILSSPDRPYMTEALAVLKLKSGELEQSTGILFEDDDDNLGFYKMALLQVQEYKYFLETHLSDSRNPGVCVSISKDTISRSDALDALLIGLDLTSADLHWIPKDIVFVEHELWRQDDNGNRMLIEKTSCKADALKKVRQFTELGHKQLYWCVQLGESER